MADYDSQRIEAKWQHVWDEQGAFHAQDGDASRPKYYLLEMLPYPSGTLHMGHMRNYTIGDAVARYKWMRGYNVLHPMGWDAFGLPAENAAIKNGIHPRDWTNKNIQEFQRVLKRFGFSYDWRREISTCEPEYYKWNQWFFLRMLEKGIAYRKKSKVNWCPECLTVLANEQVVDGFCWRHEDDARRAERTRTVVLPDHAIFRRVVGGYGAARVGLARARPRHAAQLDWEIARDASAFRRRGNARNQPRGFHYARGHDLWGLGDSCSCRASAVAANCSKVCRADPRWKVSSRPCGRKARAPPISLRQRRKDSSPAASR